MGYQSLILPLLAILLTVGPITSHAATEYITVVPITKAFVPVGFDDNDNIEIVITGFLPSTCYKMGKTEFIKDDVKKTVTILQRAYVRTDYCLQVITPFEQVIEIGRSRDGNFKVVDGATSRQLAMLPVTKAKEGPGPDDYLYAPITEVSVNHDAEHHNELVLRGTFYSRCMAMKEVRITYQADMVIVQPIVEFEPRNCSGIQRFLSVTPLADGLKGFQLLHVRTMNGKAINQIVDLTDND